MTPASPTVHRLDLPLSNAYLVVGDRPILVDTGSPGDFDRIQRSLGEHGVTLDDLALVALTHGHADHAGTAARLAVEYSVPIAAHPADGSLLAAGEARYRPQNVEARLIRRFLPTAFDPVDSDVELADGFDLTPYGVDGRVIETPGHTAGSVSVILTTGTAIVGDLLMGGYLGGAIWPTRPRNHYFADDPASLPASRMRVLDAGVEVLYVGHGGPLLTASIR